MRKSGRNPYNVTGVSFESEKLLNDARARAKSFGISLSNYLNQLVKNDLDDAAPNLIRPRQEPPHTAPYQLNERPNPAPSAPQSPEDAAAEQLGKHAVEEITGAEAAPEPKQSGIPRKFADKLKHEAQKTVRSAKPAK